MQRVRSLEKLHHWSNHVSDLMVDKGLTMELESNQRLFSLVVQNRHFHALNVPIHIHLLKISLDGKVVVVLGLEKTVYKFFQHKDDFLGLLALRIHFQAFYILGHSINGCQSYSSSLGHLLCRGRKLSKELGSDKVWSPHVPSQWIFLLPFSSSKHGCHLEESCLSFRLLYCGQPDSSISISLPRHLFPISHHLNAVLRFGLCSKLRSSRHARLCRFGSLFPSWSWNAPRNCHQILTLPDAEHPQNLLR